MSSRRKSTPVRRLDLICSNLKTQAETQDYPAQPATVFPAFVGQNAWKQQTTGQGHAMEQPTSLQGEPIDNSGEDAPTATGKQSTTAEHNSSRGFEKKRGRSLENPPEGVYILQPQGFSDDEDHYAAEPQQTRLDDDQSERKRFRDDEESNSRSYDYSSEPHQPAERDVDAGKPGLDLSVKRRKTDQGEPQAEMVARQPIEEQEDKETIGSVEKNYQIRMQKYERLLQLLGQQVPLLDAMNEVDITQRDLIELKQMKMLAANAQASQQQDPASDSENSGLERQDTPAASIASNWNPAETQWQATREREQYDSGHHTKADESTSSAASSHLNPQQEAGAAASSVSTPVHPVGAIAPFSSATLPPAVAAAFVASLVSNKDQSTNKAELLQKLFNRSSAFSQVIPPSPSSGAAPSGQYSDNADSIDTITAGTVSSGVGSIKKGTLDPTNFDEEVFDKYISKFSAKRPCMQGTCPHINRDHFHCTDSDCNFQRFTNKSDVIRHYNMHKKRDNSLAHGFMRFAPNDDCSRQFGDCHLNGKSTHYHCLHTNCTKVYTSTSDVMTHENFHKKNQQFVSNGFERFRATEPCGMSFCPFALQRTTHFHCTRPGCNFTFKNKCDIEKHKAYHTRDDAYTRQGFKKFYKNESCQFGKCSLNRTANHFHCLRQNCGFSFTSTSQMVSHKRKHDRQDLMGTDSHSTSTSPGPSMVMDQRVQPPAKFDPSVLQEAAKRVLASIPSSVATAALPQFGGFTAKSEPPSFHPSSFISSSLSASPTLPTSGQMQIENCSTPRDDYLPARSLSFNMPPSYNDQVAMETSPSYKNEDLPQRFGSSDLQTERDHWSEKRSASPGSAKPTHERDSNRRDTGEEQALNLSSKSDSASSSGEKSFHQTTLDCAAPSKAVLRFFRGLGPGECSQESCVFATCHHFHCAVVGCCAIFTEKQLVLAHTSFHEKLEQAGFEQPIASQFDSQAGNPPKNAPTPREVPRDTESPPPGYIALTQRQESVQRAPLSDDGQKQQQQQQSSVSVLDQSHDNDSSGDEQPRGDYPIASVPASYANHPVYNYLSRIVAEKKLLYPGLAQAQAGSIGSQFVMLPTSTMSATSQGQGYSSMTGHFDLGKGKFGGPESSPEPFIHIRPGMTCIRRDCKYMMQNHWHCTLNRCRYVCKSLAKAQSHRQAHDSLEAYARAAKECFRSYTVKKLCPNPNCEFRLRGHYHCLKPGCQFVTIGTSKLPWHMKKHEKIAKREASGFKYYTKKEQCGKYDCKYNGLFSHYHCIRAGCAFAFQYKHQMSTHVRKHLRRMLGRSYHGMDTTLDQGDIDHSNVDSGDDSLPLIVDEADEIEQRPGAAVEVNDKPYSFEGKSQFMHELSQQQLAVLEKIAKAGKPSHAPASGECQITSPRASPAFPGIQSTGYNDVNDVSSEEGVLDLRSNFQDVESNSNESNSKNSNDVLSATGNSPGKSGEEEMVWNPPQYFPAMDMATSNTNNRFPAKPPNDDSMFAKFRINNDVMDGFKRFESSENCGDPQCTMLFKVSHYHCTREACSYRFTGRTHMFKHQQHHERVAGLVRDDFKRYKTTQDCEIDGCQYRKTSTHFHCLRCEFKCTDSAKVGTHRRQHLKADTLEQSGFERFKGKDDCKRESCKYRHRNTSHFHCLQPGCTYSVVGLTGIEQHYNKHKRSNLLAQVCQKAGQDIDYQMLPGQANANRSQDDSSSFIPATSTNPYSQFNADSFQPHPTNHRAASSPEQSANPTFSAAAAVVTSQFNPSLMQVNQSSNTIDLSETLNLAMGQSRAVSAPIPGFPTGIGLS